MIVDDDRSILHVFSRVLERKGYTVTAVENGKEASDQIKQRYFDAALIDVRLPDINGMELLPKIQEKSPGTIKIVFTGSPDAERIGNNGNKNMDAFLVKPVKPELLLNILEQKLKAR